MKYDLTNLGKEFKDMSFLNLELREVQAYISLFNERDVTFTLVAHEGTTQDPKVTLWDEGTWEEW